MKQTLKATAAIIGIVAAVGILWAASRLLGCWMLVISDLYGVPV